jgi:hypothetical protein
VSDDVNYLDSIGRKQSAEVQKHAAIAEARNKADSAAQSAQNHQTTEISRLDAQLGTLRADMARRVTDAQTKGVAGRGQGPGGFQAGARSGRTGRAEGTRRASAPPNENREPRG